MLAISVENLSKNFRLGTLNRDVLIKQLRTKWGLFARQQSGVKVHIEKRGNTLTPHY